MHRVQNFRGTRDLKFSREEMAAIRAAEQAFGQDPDENHHNLPQGLRVLLGTMFVALLLGLIGELVVLVVHSPSAADGEKLRAPTSTATRYTAPSRHVPAVPKPRAAASANVHDMVQASSPLVTNPVPKGVIILRKYSAAELETPKVRVLRPWREVEPTEQRTVTMESSSPAEPPPVTRANTESGQIEDIGVQRASTRVTMPGPAMPMLKQPPLTGNGSWHYFTRTTKPRIRRRGGVRRVRWPRQPAPRISPFARHVIAGRGPAVPPPEFFYPPPPAPGVIPVWGAPSCGCWSETPTERRTIP